MVLPLSPLSIGSLVRESRLRVSESLAALKLEVEGVWRTLLQTGGGTAETTVSESVRGLLGTASAKVLALICLSSAGAGGAVAGREALSTESSRTARAAGLGLEHAVRGDRGSAHSADGRIVAGR
jgi:hypothetical protein